MADIDVNAMIRGIFMSRTVKVAVHFGQDYQENLCITKNADFEKVKHLFDMSQKWILDQSENFFWISTIDWIQFHGTRTTLLHERGVKLSKA